MKALLIENSIYCIHMCIITTVMIALTDKIESVLYAKMCGGFFAKTRLEHVYYMYIYIYIYIYENSEYPQIIILTQMYIYIYNI